MLRILVSLLFLLAALPAHAEFSVAPPMMGADPAPKSGVTITATESGFAAFWGSGWGRPSTLNGTILSDLLELRAIAAGVDRNLGPVPPGVLDPGAGGAATIGEITFVVAECSSPSGVRSVCLTRFSSGGEALGTIVIDEDAQVPTIASNGSAALVVFIDGTVSSLRTTAVPVGPDGSPGSPIDLGTWHPTTYAPSVAASGGSFFVAWSGEATFRIAEISGGQVIDDVPLTGAGGSGEWIHHLVLGGSSDGVLLIAAVSPSTLRFRRLDEPSTWRTLVSTATHGRRSKVIGVPGGFLVAWPEQRINGSYDVFATRISLDGTRGQVIRISDGISLVENFDLAVRGERVAAAFVSYDPQIMAEDGAFDVEARILDTSGHLAGPPKIVSLGPSPQISPAAAAGGAGFLTAWNERNADGIWRVRAQRVGAAGERLGDVLELPFTGRDQILPAIAWNGESWFVIWSEGEAGMTAIVGARIAGNGILLDPDGLELFGNGSLLDWSRVARRAHVAWDGTEWIVASSSADHQIVLRRFASSGIPAGEPVAVTSFGQNRSPLVSCGDDSCLLTWKTFIHWGCQFLCLAPPDTIVAARIRRDLSLLDPLGEPGELFEARRVTKPWDDTFEAQAVSWNPARQEWLVGWGSTGRVVDETGTFAPVSPETWDGGPISFLSAGDGWLVGWLERHTVDVYSLRIGSAEFSFANGSGLRQVRVVDRDADWDSELVLVDAPRPVVLYTRRDSTSSPLRLAGTFLDQVRPLRSRLVRRRTTD